MAGYWVAVSMTVGVPAELAVDATDRTTLALWETDDAGLVWMEALLATGFAQEVQSGGFPSVFLARASAVLPRLTGVQLQPTGELELREENIALCPLDEIVRIEVWAQE